MQKLYLTSVAPTLYWETWERDGIITVHEGVLGQVGKFREMPHSSDTARVVKTQVARLRAQGYAEVAREALSTLSIRYRLVGWGSSEDLDKRHHVEEMMDECLGWTGLGHCDGGDIGSGDMNVCCLVVDPLVALDPILECLQQHDCLEGATIAIETQGGLHILWPVDAAAARELVTEKVLRARSLPDVQEAQQTLRDWIKAHPEDEGMRDGFEQLSLLQDVAEKEQP